MKDPSKQPRSAGLLDEGRLADAVIGNKPLRKTTRGIRVATGPLDVYAADPDRWPRRSDGEPIPQLCWGGLSEPLHRANLHYMIAGVPGTGKTLSIRLLLQSILAPEAAANLPGTDRAVIYDPKLEFFPILRGMGVRPDQILVLNPFDTRSAPWDLAADYTTAAEAYQLARTLIPVPPNHSQPFFPKSAASLLAAVISVFMRRHPGAWDLADVLAACCDVDSILRRFEEDPSNPYVVIAANLIREASLGQNIMAELTSHLFELYPVAACWRSARNGGVEPFSIRRFVKERDRIVLLGANQTHSEALKSINRLLLKRFAEVTIDNVDAGQWQAENRTWLVLDEVRELGRVEGLSDLINKGRSRGVCCVLGFQDYSGMKKAFGEHEAHELTATCAHKIFLRLGAESAEWASRAIGKGEVTETQFTRSTGMNLNVSKGDSAGQNWGRSRGPVGGSAHEGAFSSQSRSTAVGFSTGISVTNTTRETDAVFASEIAHLPGFEEGGGLTGFVSENGRGGDLAQVRRVEIPAELFVGWAGTSDDPGFAPRSSGQQDLFAAMREQR